jgi:DNA-binding winged helix-turn-helix (wHTH) protein/Tfp pilus assembly protein PilF
MTRYRFSVFEADAASGELFRAGRAVRLAPQPFQALVLFLERAGDVVSREELKRALWHEATFVEFDQGVNFVVSRIRMALGDDARAPRFLETLPRRGYRFIAAVERIEDPVRSPPSATTARAAPVTPAMPGTPGPLARRLARAAVVLLGLLASDGTGRVRHLVPAPARAAFERGQGLAGEGRRRQSLVEFRRAVEIDPSFAEAHFAIGSVYTSLAEAGELAATEAFPIARAEAERALALEDVADSHLVLGTALFFYDWDRERARREFERAIALEPAANVPWMAYARLLSAGGEHEAALRAIAHAEALGPSCDLAVHEAGWVHYRARGYVEAIRKFERAATLGPPRSTDGVSWRKLNRFRIFMAHLLMGATAAAAEDAHEVVRLSDPGPEVLARFLALGDREANERLMRGSLRLLERAAEKEYVSPVRFAELHAALGEEEQALRWLSRAAAERAPALAYSAADPVFDRLREKPGFPRLVPLRPPAATPGPLGLLASLVAGPGTPR